MTKNPPVSLSITLDEFNHIQTILAERPFREVADLIISTRRQVEMQLQTLREQEIEPAPEPVKPPARLHLAPTPDPESEPASA